METLHANKITKVDNMNTPCLSFSFILLFCLVFYALFWKSANKTLISALQNSYREYIYENRIIHNPLGASRMFHFGSPPKDYHLNK